MYYVLLQMNAKSQIRVKMVDSVLTRREVTDATVNLDTMGTTAKMVISGRAIFFNLEAMTWR